MSAGRRVALGLLAGAFAGAGFVVWYTMNMGAKLAAAVSPEVSFDAASAEFSVDVLTPSALVPALVVGAVLAVIAVLGLNVYPSVRLQTVPATSILAGPVVLWAAIAVTYVSNLAWGVPSYEWLAVSTRSELLAASVVILAPGITAAVTVRRRAQGLLP